VFSQPVLLALIGSGLARDAAYRIVQRDARAAHEQRRSFRDILAEDPRSPRLSRHRRSDEVTRRGVRSHRSLATSSAPLQLSRRSLDNSSARLPCSGRATTPPSAQVARGCHSRPCSGRRPRQQRTTYAISVRKRSRILTGLHLDRRLQWIPAFWRPRPSPLPLARSRSRSLCVTRNPRDHNKSLLKLRKSSRLGAGAFDSPL